MRSFCIGTLLVTLPTVQLPANCCTVDGGTLITYCKYRAFGLLVATGLQLAPTICGRRSRGPYEICMAKRCDHTVPPSSISGPWPLSRVFEVVFLRGVRALGLQLAGGGEFFRWFLIRRHNVGGSREQLLAHGMAVEDGHGDVRSWESGEAASDCDMVCLT